MEIHNSDMDLTKEKVLVLIIEDEDPSWFLIDTFSPYNGIWQLDYWFDIWLMRVVDMRQLQMFQKVAYG